eukprot:687770-Pyramimonas_sp.AAC.1
MGNFDASDEANIYLALRRLNMKRLDENKLAIAVKRRRVESGVLQRPIRVAPKMVAPDLEGTLPSK